MIAHPYRRELNSATKPAAGRPWLDKAVGLKATDMPEWWSEIGLTVVRARRLTLTVLRDETEALSKKGMP